MRTNTYVVDNLIDWSSVPEDPIFQLVFPQPGMLSTEDFTRIHDMVKQGKTSLEIRKAAKVIRDAMNPHPAGEPLVLRVL